MNKKALIRAYKDSRRPMGVYRVHNTRNGWSLVGRSVDLPSILNRERAVLRLGAHGNAALQRDWKAFGADAFVFEVLDTLTPPEDQPGYDPSEDLRILEMLWLERLDAAGALGYTRRPAVAVEKPGDL